MHWQKIIINILDEYGLRKKMMACMKNVRSNLNVMIIALKYFGSCDVLELKESFQETCFGHVFSKAYQYATKDEKGLQMAQICVYKVCI
jgi:hypothetical protein